MKYHEKVDTLENEYNKVKPLNITLKVTIQQN